MSYIVGKSSIFFEKLFFWNSSVLGGPHPKWELVPTLDFLVWMTTHRPCPNSGLATKIRGSEWVAENPGGRYEISIPHSPMHKALIPTAKP